MSSGNQISPVGTFGYNPLGISWQLQNTPATNNEKCPRLLSFTRNQECRDYFKKFPTPVSLFWRHLKDSLEQIFPCCRSHDTRLGSIIRHLDECSLGLSSALAFIRFTDLREIETENFGVSNTFFGTGVPWNS